MWNICLLNFFNNKREKKTWFFSICNHHHKNLFIEEEIWKIYASWKKKSSSKQFTLCCCLKKMKRKNERKKNGRIQFYKMRGEKKKYAFNHQMDSVSLMRMLVAWVGHSWVDLGLRNKRERKDSLTGKYIPWGGKK